MEGKTAPRALIGRVLIGSGLIMLIVAVAFAAGVTSVPDQTRSIIVGTFVAVGLIDVLLGFMFMRTSE